MSDAARSTAELLALFPDDATPKSITPEHLRAVVNSLPLSHIRGLTLPLLASFTARGISNLVAAQEGDGIYVRIPANYDGMQGYTKTKAGTLLKATIAFFPQIAGSNTQAGLFLRESSSGLGLHFGVTGNQNLTLMRLTAANKWLSTTLDWAPPAWRPSLVFLQVEDNGVNRICRYSADQGRHWLDIYSEARTGHAVMNEVGFGAFCVSQSWANAMHIVHFSES